MKSGFVGYKSTSGTGQSNVDVLTTNFDTHAASGVLHANVNKTSQGTQAVALGDGAGFDNQGDRSVAVGYNAGANTQGVQAVTLGHSAGKDNQGQDAVAIGYSAASQSQGAFAVAIGSVAANTEQGDYAIAIGRSAAAANQNTRSVCINATNNAITVNQQGLFVAPVRDENTDVEGKVMCYDTSTKEVILRNKNIIEKNFTFDPSAFFQLYSDEYITVQWVPSIAQLRWQKDDAYPVAVNAGQHLIQDSNSQIASGRVTGTTSSDYYYFSSTGTARDTNFDIGTNVGVRCLCWISSGGATSAIVPHYTIEFYGGGVNRRFFGVVRRHNH